MLSDDILTTFFLGYQAWLNDEEEVFHTQPPCLNFPFSYYNYSTIPTPKSTERAKIMHIPQKNKAF